MTERIPAEAFHPSVIIQDEMVARGWDRSMLALQMGGGLECGPHEFCRHKLRLDIYFEIGPVRKNCRLGDALARDLAAAFDVAPDYFINLEKAWLAHPSTQAMER